MDYIALRRIKIGGVVYNLGDTITADALTGADVYKLLHRKWIQFAGNSEDGGGILETPDDGKLRGLRNRAWDEVPEFPSTITLTMMGFNMAGLDPAKEYALKTVYVNGMWAFRPEEIVRS